LNKVDQTSLALGSEKHQTSMEEVAWQTSSSQGLPDKSYFTKEVARCWNEASFSTKFQQFHPNWQRVLLSFAKKVQKIEDSK
jgi:predicted metalloendopeptidase